MKKKKINKYSSARDVKRPISEGMDPERLLPAKFLKNESLSQRNIRNKKKE